MTSYKTLAESASTGSRSACHRQWSGRPSSVTVAASSCCSTCGSLLLFMRQSCTNTSGTRPPEPSVATLPKSAALAGLRWSTMCEPKTGSKARSVTLTTWLCGMTLTMTPSPRRRGASCDGSQGRMRKGKGGLLSFKITVRQGSRAVIFIRIRTPACVYAPTRVYAPWGAYTHPPPTVQAHMRIRGVGCVNAPIRYMHPTLRIRISFPRTKPKFGPSEASNARRRGLCRLAAKLRCVVPSNHAL